MVARVAGWRLIQRVTGRRGPLARGCDQGFSAGVVSWMESDLEGDGLGRYEDASMISRVQCRSRNWLVASVSMMLEVGEGIRE